VEVPIVPHVSDQIDYLSADAEDKFTIAQANALLTEVNEFVRERISCRYHSGLSFSTPEAIDYMDVAPHQVVGISAALIPFLNMMMPTRVDGVKHARRRPCPSSDRNNSPCLNRYGSATPRSTRGRSWLLKWMVK